MATCPFCHQEALRISPAVTPAEVIKNILRHLKLAAHFWHTATLQP
jgi:hypothetical protein